MSNTERWVLDLIGRKTPYYRRRGGWMTIREIGANKDVLDSLVNKHLLEREVGKLHYKDTEFHVKYRIKIETEKNTRKARTIRKISLSKTDT